MLELAIRLIHWGMKRSEAIAKLKAAAPGIRIRGARSLYLFGPAARDKMTPKSDLDIFIDVANPDTFSLIELVDIKFYLERALGVEVDVTTRDSLHPMLRQDIEQSAIRIF